MKPICLILIILFSFALNAQERYKWYSIEEIKFYDLGKLDCYSIDSVDKIPRDLKSVAYKKPIWESIIQSKSSVIRDVSKENSCYVLIVKFKRGESIPFLLYPDQKSIFDMRKGHFNYINLKNNVYENFDKALKLSLECLNNPKCKEIK